MTTPMNSPKNSEGSSNIDNAVYTHTNLATKLPEEIEKLEYIYQHFQDCEKIYEIDPQVPTEHIDNALYSQINNDIEYGLFENVIDSYYLNSQIRDVFTCTKACYVHNDTNNILETRLQCTHTNDHISQQLDSLADTEQQCQVYTSEVDTSLFTSDTSTQCAFNIILTNTDVETDKPLRKYLRIILAFISIVNINVEILLEMHIYSIMTSIMVMLSLIKTNILHCYNKSYKVPTGVYTIL